MPQANARTSTLAAYAQALADLRLAADIQRALVAALVR